MANIPISSLPADLVYNGQLDVSNPAKQSKYNELNSKYNSSNSGMSGGDMATAPQLDTIWSDPAKLNNYLKGYQDTVLGQLGVNTATPTAKPATDQNGNPITDIVPADGTALAPGNGNNTTYTQIASALTPTAQAPELLDRKGLFQQYRQDYGVDGLETRMNDLKTQSEALAAQTRINVKAEQGKTVASNIVEGRVSVQKQQAQDQMDFINRQINTVTDQLNTAYNVIGMYVNFAGLDYQDAVTKYNTEFTQNLQIFDMLRGIRQDALGELKQSTDVKFQQAGLNLQYQDSARANLQIMSNAITSGNLDPNSLSLDQKTQMAKLEVQSGLPVGFVSSLGLSNKDKIISTSTDNGVTQVLMQDAAGNITVKKYGTSTKQGAAGNPAQEKALKADIAKKMTLEQVMSKYGNSVSPDTILANYNAGSPWGQAKQSAQELHDTYNVTSKSASSTLTPSDINKASQALLKNSGSDDDLKRVKTDPDFANWVIATYGD